MAEKTLILVVGCHRSGTSAVAGCLSAMGVEFGDNLLPPAADNPRGFFECRDVVTMHDLMFATVGASWDKPTIGFGPMPGGATFRDLAGPIIRSLPGPVCAIKDPRASFFIDEWAEACKAEGVDFCVIHVQRDKEAVAASLAKREGWQPWRAEMLYTDHVRAIGYEPRCDRWACMSFPDDLADESAWRLAFGLLEVPIEPDMEAIRESFDASLVHHAESTTHCCKTCGSEVPEVEQPRRVEPETRKWTVIIPSRSDEKVLDCVASLVEAHPEIEPEQIVIVDDGLSRYTRWKLRSLTLVRGVKPFVFARAINMGVDAAPPDSDIVILGDDVRFSTSDALDRLAVASVGAAAVAPEVTGVCGQPAQRYGSKPTTADWLAFICVYIPRMAWDTVGPLDASFVGYGYDDVDWCKRAQPLGELRISREVRVEHVHDSSYRTRQDFEMQYAKNRAIFEEKWRQQGVA